jgi:hypothetical protein
MRSRRSSPGPVAGGFLLALPLVLGLGCETESAWVPQPGDTLVVRIGIRGDTTGAEDFLVRTTRASLAESVRAELGLPTAQRAHVYGRLRYAQDRENLNWTWAIEPDTWSFQHFSVEICCGTSTAVEQDLDWWMNDIQWFCPWEAYAKDTSWVRHD